MDRCRGGKNQRREEKEDQRKERGRRKKMQAREKVEQSQNAVFLQCFVAPKGVCVVSAKIRHIATSEQKHAGFVAVWKTLKNVGRRGTFEDDLQRWSKMQIAWQRSTRDMFIRDVRRSGRWFPETGCILEHQIFEFAKMILSDMCSTSYDLVSLRMTWSYFRHMDWKNRKTQRYEAVSSALNFNHHYWSKLHFWCCQLRNLTKSGRLASFLTLSSSKVEDVSQNCCVLMLSSSKIEDVSRTSFVFNLADRQPDRQTDRQTQ